MIRLFAILVIIFGSVQHAYAAQAKITQAQLSLLNAAQDYLAKVRTIKANFIQLNPQSSIVSSGSVLISKPGLLKMSYNAPFEIDYYINGDSLLQYDHELDEITRGSAPDNPLKVLLFDDITLSNNDLMKVTNVVDEGNSFSIFLLNKTDNIRDVTGLILNFRKMPVEIMGIERVDNEGNKTETNFTSVKINEKISDDEFVFKKSKAAFPNSRKKN